MAFDHGGAVLGSIRQRWLCFRASRFVLSRVGPIALSGADPATVVNMKPRWWLLTIGLAAGIVPARAENNFVLRDVTRGVVVPTGAGIAGDFDLGATVSNPAGLATLGGPAVGFAATRLQADRTVRGGGGWGAFVAFPLTLPSPAGEEPFRLTYGFSWQSFEAPSPWTGAATAGREQPYDATYFVNSVGAGTSRASIGWTVATVDWARTPENQGSTTHHVGLNLHPSRFFALGLVLRDVFQPEGRSELERFRRASDIELAVRPMGDWRLELAAGALVGEDDLIDWRGRAVVRALPGVTVFGHLESIERPFGGETLAPSRDWRVLAGLSIDLRFGQDQNTAGVSLGQLTSQRGSGNVGAGTSVFVHATRERFPSFIEPARFEQMDVEGEIDEREHVRNLVRLEEIARTGEVEGMVLVIGPHDLGWGRTEEMREAVQRLRARGKSVVTYLKEADMRGYYLAVAADRVVIHPSATVRLTGLATMQIYLRSLLDRVGIGVQILQVGDYKSAGEMFGATGPSPESREQVLALLGDVHDRWKLSVAKARKLTVAEVEARVANPGLSPQDLKRAKLVDAVAFQDRLDDSIERVLGRRVELARHKAATARRAQWASPKIAVVHVSGDIVDGDEEGGGLFSDEPSPRAVAKVLREARESPEFKAIVLRVNSPGGMVRPSEEIAREVERTRGVKPIVVSMGDVAASGGYWVSAVADEIVAPPSAITGSIGVVGLKFDIDGLAGRLGLGLHTEKTGPHADGDSLVRPWSEQELAARQAEMLYFYGRFLDRVAKGRKQSRGAVEAIAGGRIWSGAQAKDRGLVDRVGGLSVALEQARARAGLGRATQVQVVSLPARSGSLIQRLVGPQAPLSKAQLPRPLRTLLGSVSPLLSYPPGVLVRWPWAEALLVYQ